MLLCSDALHLSKGKALGKKKSINKIRGFTCSQQREVIIFVNTPLELLYFSTPRRVTFKRAHAHFDLGINISQTPSPP